MSRQANVLVIDDEPMFQDLARAILATAGHRVHVAENAFDALQLLGHTSFHCILVDYHLPEMDGYALARLVRDMVRDRNEAPLLLAVTGDREGLALRRGSDSLFYAILPKPIAPAILLAKVEEAVLAAGRQDAERAARALVERPEEANAMAAARAFWMAAGLTDRPRMAAWPTPTQDQARALSLCFDISPVDGADGLVILETIDTDVFAREVGPAGYLLPTVSVGSIESPLVDIEFSLLDQGSWSSVADLVVQTTARRRQIPDYVRASNDPVDRIANFLHSRARELPADADLTKLGLPRLPGTAMEIRRRVEERLTWIVEQASSEAYPTPMVEGPGSPTSAVRGQITVDPPSAPAGPNAAVSGGRILLVEPSDLLADILASLLTSQHHEVTVATSAAGAVRSLADREQDVVIVSLALWRSEPDLARASRAAHGNPSLLLMVPAGEAAPTPAEVGAAGLLSTPVKPLALREQVAALVSARATDARFDAGAFDEVVAEVGPAIADQLWAKLADRLAMSESRGTNLTSAEWRAEAHNLKAAGTLGFVGLAAVCGELEEACKSGQDIENSLMRFLIARETSLDRLRSRVPPGDNLQGGGPARHGMLKRP